MDFGTTQLGVLDSALRKALEESGISRATAQSVQIVFMQGSIIAELNLRVRADIRVVQNNKATIRATTIQYLQAAMDIEAGADLIASTAADQEDATASATTVVLIVCLSAVVLALVATAVIAIRKLKTRADGYDVSATPDDPENHTYMELHAGESFSELNTLASPPRRDDGFPTAIGALESYKGPQNAFDLEDPANVEDLAEIRKRTDASLADALNVIDVVREDGRKMSLSRL